MPNLPLPNGGYMSNFHISECNGYEDLTGLASFFLEGSDGYHYFAEYDYKSHKWTTPAYYIIEDGRPEYILVKETLDSKIIYKVTESGSVPLRN